MGDLLELIKEIREDKEKFVHLVDKMNPLIKKYIRLLYMDEKEDTYSELILALWEALVKMKYAENEGQCLMFLSNALKNKFLELYKISKKYYDKQLDYKLDINQGISFVSEMEYINLELSIDLKDYLNKYSGLKYQINYSILIERLSDADIANKYGVSRQYVYRLKKQLYEDIKRQYFKL